LAVDGCEIWGWLTTCRWPPVKIGSERGVGTRDVVAVGLTRRRRRECPDLT